MRRWKETGDLRILDWDLECRPLSWISSDYVSSEITAIACSWLAEKRVHVWLLGKHEPAEMLGGFQILYEQADVVTGHYICRHDLPIISGALLEFNLRPLSPKLTSDTYRDLVKHKYLSASQEALAGMYALERHKKHMSQPEWREANRLTKSGLAKTRQRVVSDVAQHKVLRARLIQAGALGPPRMWYP